MGVIEPKLFSKYHVYKSKISDGFHLHSWCVYEKIGARPKQTRSSVVGKAPISTNSVTDRLDGLIG